MKTALVFNYKQLNISLLLFMSNSRQKIILNKSRTLSWNPSGSSDRLIAQGHIHLL